MLIENISFKPNTLTSPQKLTAVANGAVVGAIAVANPVAGLIAAGCLYTVGVIGSGVTNKYEASSFKSKSSVK